MKGIKVFVMVIIGFLGILGFSGCSCSEGGAHSHIYSVQAGTYNCVNGGEATFECSCGESYTDTFSPRPHDFDKNNVCQNCALELKSTDGLVYNQLTNGNYEVIGYTGSAQNVVIPYVYNGKNVESIGASSFKDKNIVSLTFSDNITSIGMDAFLGVTSLQEVHFEGLQNDYFNINLGSDASSPFLSNAKFFVGKNEILRDDMLVDVVTIKPYTLSGVEFNDTINIPKSLVGFNANAFSGAKYDKVSFEGDFSEYNEIYFEDETASPLYNKSAELYFNGVLFEGEIEIEALSDFVLSGFNGESVTFKNVKEVGDYALSNCERLTSVTFDENLTTLGKGFLSNCVNLDKITIPNSVTSIQSDTFAGVKSKVDLSLASSLEALPGDAFYGYAGEEIVVGASILTLMDEALANITSVTDLRILGTARFGKDLFSNSNITNLHIESVPTFIDFDAFLSSQIESVYLGFSLTDWWEVPRALDTLNTQIAGSGAKKIYVNDALLSGIVSLNIDVPSYAFYGLVDVTGFEINGADIDIGDYAFCGSGLTGEIIFDSTGEIGDYAFQNCENITKVKITNNGSLSRGAFYDCENLSEVELQSPQSLSYESVFGDNTHVTHASAVINALSTAASGNLTNLTILSSGDSDQLNYINSCTNLTHLILDNIETIGMEVFSSFMNLKTVSIINANSIGSYAFSGCYNLYFVELQGETFEYISNNAFLNCYKLIEIKNDSNLSLTLSSEGQGGMAKYAKNIYSSTTGESKINEVEGHVFFEDVDTNYLISIGDVKSLIASYNGEDYEIYDYACYNNKTLTNVTLAQNVMRVGKYAFSGCENLVEVDILEGTNFIDENAFLNCNAGLAITCSNSTYTSWAENWHGGNSVKYE